MGARMTAGKAVVAMGQGALRLVSWLRERAAARMPGGPVGARAHRGAGDGAADAPWDPDDTCAFEAFDSEPCDSVPFGSGPLDSQQRHVRFTPRAWGAVLSEALLKAETETGGIFLGYRDGRTWTVVETLDPGPNSVFEFAYFEYDQPYVTHLANRVSRLYARRLEVLGLWHRHPGSFDRFSGTDDGTNERYARMYPDGAISALLNVDPVPRLTVRHVGKPLHYTDVGWSVMTEAEAAAVAPYAGPALLADHLARRVAGEGSRPRTASAAVPAAYRVSAAHAATALDAHLAWLSRRVEATPPPVTAGEDPVAEAVRLLAGDLAYLDILQLESSLRLAGAEVPSRSDTGAVGCADALVLSVAGGGEEAVELAYLELSPAGAVAAPLSGPLIVSPRTGDSAAYRPGLIERALRQVG